MLTFDRLKARAQVYSNMSGKESVILNLNRVGSPQYVIRDREEVKDSSSIVAGPFKPQSE